MSHRWCSSQPYPFSVYPDIGRYAPSIPVLFIALSSHARLTARNSRIFHLSLPIVYSLTYNHQRSSQNEYDEDIIERPGELCNSRQNFAMIPSESLTNSQKSQKLLIESFKSLQQRERQREQSGRSNEGKGPNPSDIQRWPEREIENTRTLKQKLSKLRQNTFADQIKIEEKQKKRENNNYACEKKRRGTCVNFDQKLCAKLFQVKSYLWKLLSFCHIFPVSVSQFRFVISAWEFLRSWI